MEHRTATDLSSAHFPIDYKGISIPGHGYMLAWGPAAPADEVSGYGTGCLFLHTDDDTAVLTSGTALLFVNRGTNASANFNPVTVAADAE